MTKYTVQACTNCVNFKLNKKTKERTCEEGNTEVMEDWLSTSGKKKLADLSPKDDLKCFQPNSKFIMQQEMNRNLNNFMSDLNDMLNN